MNTRPIFITGGHATPAIACIHELQSRGYTNLVFVGQKKSLLFDKNPSSEYRIITEKIHIPFYSIIAGKISLFWGIESLIWLLRLPIGFLQAFWWVLSKRPALILTFGSHVGVPVVFAAWLLRIPVVAHEQTVTIGRSNKTIQKYAKKVCFSWENSIQASSDPDKFIYTGNPIRKEILERKTDTFIFANPERKTIFITGGNQGAHAINEWIFNNLNQITKHYNVIHQTGSNSIYNDFERAQKLGYQLNDQGIVYIPQNYVFAEEMAEAYDRSDIIISRGGANTVTELLALKKRAIIIPLLTSSGNEQFLNGKLLEELGLAVVQKQDSLNEIPIMELIAQGMNLIITNEQEVARLSQTHQNAEKRIVDVVISLIEKT